MAISIKVTNDEIYGIKNDRNVTVYYNATIRYDVNADLKMLYIHSMGNNLFYIPYDRIEVKDHHNVQCVTLIYNGIDLITFYT